MNDQEYKAEELTVKMFTEFKERTDKRFELIEQKLDSPDPILDAKSIQVRLNIKVRYFFTILDDLKKYGAYKEGGRWKMQDSDLQKYINTKKKQ